MAESTLFEIVKVYRPMGGGLRSMEIETCQKVSIVYGEDSPIRVTLHSPALSVPPVTYVIPGPGEECEVGVDPNEIIIENMAGNTVHRFVHGRKPSKGIVSGNFRTSTS